MARFKKFVQASFLDLSEEITAPKAVIRGNINGFFMLYRAIITAINCLNGMELKDQSPVLQLESFKNGINSYLKLEPFIENEEAPILTTETIGLKGESSPFALASFVNEIAALMLDKSELNAFLGPLLIVRDDKCYESLALSEPESFNYLESLVPALQQCIAELDGVTEATTK